MKTLRLHPGELFHIKDRHLKNGPCGACYHIGPAWTPLPDNEVVCYFDWRAEKPVFTKLGEYYIPVFELAAADEDEAVALKKVRESLETICQEILALGAKEVLLIHWSDIEVHVKPITFTECALIGLL